MTYLKQTIRGDRGNCFAACLASLLGLSSMEGVPNFCNRKRWVLFTRRWLRKRGYELIVAKGRCRLDLARSLHICSIRPSKSDKNLHAVIARGRTLIWDPVPSYKGGKIPMVGGVHDRFFIVGSN